MTESLETYDIFLDKTVSENPDSMVRSHAHDFHELYFLISGQRRYFIGHKIYDISPGNLVIIPHTELHRTTSTGMAGYDRYVLFVYEKKLLDFIDTLGREAYDLLMHGGCLNLPKKMIRQIQRDMELLLEECASESTYGYTYANHLVQDVLLCAPRYGKQKNTCMGESADKIQDSLHGADLFFQAV